MRKDMLYQMVFDYLEPQLPERWDEVVFYAEYSDVSYIIEFYVKEGKTFTKCFDIPHTSMKELLSTFAEIDKLLSTERKNTSKKNLWTTMTMVVTNKGKVKVDYEYDDLTENAFAHKKKWRSKYLA